jgi:hypothetical protein
MCSIWSCTAVSNMEMRPSRNSSCLMKVSMVNRPFDRAWPRRWLHLCSSHSVPCSKSTWGGRAGARGVAGRGIAEAFTRGRRRRAVPRRAPASAFYWATFMIMVLCCSGSWVGGGGALILGMPGWQVCCQGRSPGCCTSGPAPLTLMAANSRKSRPVRHPGVVDMSSAAGCWGSGASSYRVPHLRPAALICCWRLALLPAGHAERRSMGTPFISCILTFACHGALCVTGSPPAALQLPAAAWLRRCRRARWRGRALRWGAAETLDPQKRLTSSKIFRCPLEDNRYPDIAGALLP